MKIGNEESCLPPVQDIGVLKAITHPQYNTPQRANDIGLVRLAQDVDFSKFNVMPICLPITSELMNTPLPNYIVTGWGTTENGRSSSKLLKARLPSVALETCQNLFRSTRLSQGQMCAGGENKTDSCTGDSGT